jgi:hypothetical protein
MKRLEVFGGEFLQSSWPTYKTRTAPHLEIPTCGLTSLVPKVTIVMVFESYTIK